MDLTVLGTSFFGADAVQGALAARDVTRGVYDRVLLERALPELVYNKYGMRKTLAQRQGLLMAWRRYVAWAAITTPLTEGTPPPGVQVATENLSAVLKEYGNYAGFSTLLALTNMDDTAQEIVALAGENMGLSLDTITRNIIVAGTSVHYVKTDGATLSSQALGTDRAGSGTGVAGSICKLVCDHAITHLKGANAKPFTPQIDASARINTMPVAPAFWVIIHTDQENDLHTNARSGFTVGTDFIPVERYSGQQGVLLNEIGKYRNLRFITTTNCYIALGGGDTGSATYRRTSSACDVYCNLVLGRNAYGTVDLTMGNSKTIMEGPGGVGDPLRQKRTIGWKAVHTAAILNDNFMTRIECASMA